MSTNSHFIENAALGIEAKILFFLEKIEAESPPLSCLRKGNAQIKGFTPILVF